MKRFFLAMMLAAPLVAAHADDPKTPNSNKTDTPKGVLTPVGLGEMLKDLAYEPKDLSENQKKDIWQITTVNADNWKIFITISLSTDGKNVWFEAKFAPIADVEAVPAAAWLKLLQLSNENGIIHFTLDNKKRIHLYQSIANVRITPAVLRKEIEWFDTVVRKTEPSWKSANFKALPKMEPLTDGGRKVLEQLVGAWVVVEETRNGKKSSEADVKDSAITYVCVGDKCRIKSRSSAEVEATLWAENKGKDPIALDLVFMEKRLTQKAILKIDGDTITMCVANPDQPRPTEFNAGADFKGMMMVLKKQK